jgi:hypothetical protein
MKLEDIEAEWAIDSIIDRTQLGNEAVKITSLQAKYYKWYVREVLQLKAMEENLNIFKLELWEHLTQGPTEESFKRGWKVLPKGNVLKADVDRYMDGDASFISEKLKVAKQKEKANFLKHIIDSLNGRSWNIRAAIDFEKFRAGG